MLLLTYRDMFSFQRLCSLLIEEWLMGEWWRQRYNSLHELENRTHALFSFDGFSSSRVKHVRWVILGGFELERILCNCNIEKAIRIITVLGPWSRSFEIESRISCVRWFVLFRFLKRSVLINLRILVIFKQLISNRSIA